ncbi:mucin-5AC-like [Amphibalanus amphitrite]|uniref:mucin-5AC-like n=1 Tax=Amphibalanus amphitrite TaxID=1232801 RepID=UPI001C908BF0|nr:mucin-5AC-like [Amphibalanus amphitrite]
MDAVPAPKFRVVPANRLAQRLNSQRRGSQRLSLTRAGARRGGRVSRVLPRSVQCVVRGRAAATDKSRGRYRTRQSEKRRAAWAAAALQHEFHARLAEYDRRKGLQSVHMDKFSMLEVVSGAGPGLGAADPDLEEAFPPLELSWSCGQLVGDLDRRGGDDPAPPAATATVAEPASVAAPGPPAATGKKPLTDRADALTNKIGPLADSYEPVADSYEPVADRSEPVADTTVQESSQSSGPNSSSSSSSSSSESSTAEDSSVSIDSEAGHEGGVTTRQGSAISSQSGDSGSRGGVTTRRGSVAKCQSGDSNSQDAVTTRHSGDTNSHGGETESQGDETNSQGGTRKSSVTDYQGGVKTRRNSATDGQSGVRRRRGSVTDRDDAVKERRDTVTSRQSSMTDRQSSIEASASPVSISVTSSTTVTSGGTTLPTTSVSSSATASASAVVTPAPAAVPSTKETVSMDVSSDAVSVVTLSDTEYVRTDLTPLPVNVAKIRTSRGRGARGSRRGRISTHGRTDLAVTTAVSTATVPTASTTLYVRGRGSRGGRRGSTSGTVIPTVAASTPTADAVPSTSEGTMVRPTSSPSVSIISTPGTAKTTTPAVAVVTTSWRTIAPPPTGVIYGYRSIPFSDGCVSLLSPPGRMVLAGARSQSATPSPKTRPSQTGPSTPLVQLPVSSSSSPGVSSRTAEDSATDKSFVAECQRRGVFPPPPGPAPGPYRMVSVPGVRGPPPPGHQVIVVRSAGGPAGSTVRYVMVRGGSRVTPATDTAAARVKAASPLDTTAMQQGGGSGARPPAPVTLALSGADRVGNGGVGDGGWRNAAGPAKRSDVPAAPLTSPRVGGGGDAAAVPHTLPEMGAGGTPRYATVTSRPESRSDPADSDVPLSRENSASFLDEKPFSPRSPKKRSLPEDGDKPERKMRLRSGLRLAGCPPPAKQPRLTATRIPRAARQPRQPHRSQAPVERGRGRGRGRPRKVVRSPELPEPVVPEPVVRELTPQRPPAVAPSRRGRGRVGPRRAGAPRQRVDRRAALGRSPWSLAMLCRQVIQGPTPPQARRHPTPAERSLAKWSDPPPTAAGVTTHHQVKNTAPWVQRLSESDEGHPTREPVPEPPPRSVNDAATATSPSKSLSHIDEPQLPTPAITEMAAVAEATEKIDAAPTAPVPALATDREEHSEATKTTEETVQETELPPATTISASSAAQAVAAWHGLMNMSLSSVLGPERGGPAGGASSADQANAPLPAGLSFEGVSGLVSDSGGSDGELQNDKDRQEDRPTEDSRQEMDPSGGEAWSDTKRRSGTDRGQVAEFPERPVEPSGEKDDQSDFEGETGSAAARPPEPESALNTSCPEQPCEPSPIKSVAVDRESAVAADVDASSSVAEKTEFSPLPSDTQTRDRTGFSFSTPMTLKERTGDARTSRTLAQEMADLNAPADTDCPDMCGQGETLMTSSAVELDALIDPAASGSLTLNTSTGAATATTTAPTTAGPPGPRGEPPIKTCSSSAEENMSAEELFLPDLSDDSPPPADETPSRWLQARVLVKRATSRQVRLNCSPPKAKTTTPTKSTGAADGGEGNSSAPAERSAAPDTAVSPGDRVPGPPRWKCRFCEWSALSSARNAIQQHRASHKNCCYRCRVAFSTREQMAAHRKTAKHLGKVEESSRGRDTGSSASTTTSSTNNTDKNTNSTSTGGAGGTTGGGGSPHVFYYCGVCQRKIHGRVMIDRHFVSNVHLTRAALCRSLLKDVRRILENGGDGSKSDVSTGDLSEMVREVLGDQYHDLKLAAASGAARGAAGTDSNNNQATIHSSTTSRSTELSMPALSEVMDRLVTVMDETEPPPPPPPPPPAAAPAANTAATARPNSEARPAASVPSCTGSSAGTGASPCQRTAASGCRCHEPTSSWGPPRWPPPPGAYAPPSAAAGAPPAAEARPASTAGGGDEFENMWLQMVSR